MRTRIKLCGMRTEEAVLACVQAGADAVGFVHFEPSPRHVDLATAATLARHLGAFQVPVVLFVNPDPGTVAEAARRIPNSLFQFHGDEPPEFCRQFGRPYVKAVRMKPGVDLKAVGRDFHDAQALLVDSWSEGYGGSGHSFDWSLLPQPSELEQALVLSGGLDESNVGQAIARLKPYGVDVSSGIESSKGVKDTGKILRFCRAVYEADCHPHND